MLSLFRPVKFSIIQCDIYGNSQFFYRLRRLLFLFRKEKLYGNYLFPTQETVFEST